MWKIIDWIKSIFCKHDWELVQISDVYSDLWDKYPVGRKYIYICKKCKTMKINKTY